MNRDLITFGLQLAAWSYLVTVHVGIVLYNSVEDLPTCIDALRQQTYDDLRLHAFDNASTDGSAVWIRENAPNVLRTVSAENVGFGAAHNRILRDLMARESFGDGDYYLALNPDARLSADYVAKLVAVMRRDERVGWASGKLIQPHPQPLSIGEGRTTEQVLYSAGHGVLRNGYAFNIGYGMADDAQFAESREVFGVPAAAVLMRAAFVRDLWEDGALYDEAFFLYGEDTDVDWRGQRRGWTCWLEADAIAEHRGSVASPRHAAEAIANRYLSAVGNATVRDRWLLILPLMVAHTAARLILSSSNGSAMLRTLRHGLPTVWQRRNRAWRDQRMETWFAWSRQQPTSQPRGWRERLKAYRGKIRK